MAPFDELLRIALIVATGFLFLIVLVAYVRMRSTRLLLITAGFAEFFVNALLYMPEIIDQSISLVLSDNLHIAFNLIALVLIAIGIVSEEK